MVVVVGRTGRWHRKVAGRTVARKAVVVVDHKEWVVRHREAADRMLM